MAYVRDVDTQQALTRIADLERNRVVVVPGAHGVDGDAGKAAEILTPPDLSLVDILWDEDRRSTDVRRKLGWQAELANDGGDIGSGVIRVAEDFHDPAFGVGVARRPGFDAGDNSLSGSSPFAVFGGYVDVPYESRIVRLDGAVATVGSVSADHGPDRPFHHSDDPHPQAGLDGPYGW